MNIIIVWVYELTGKQKVLQQKWVPTFQGTGVQSSTWKTAQRGPLRIVNCNVLSMMMCKWWQCKWWQSFTLYCHVSHCCCPYHCSLSKSFSSHRRAVVYKNFTLPIKLLYLDKTCFKDQWKKWNSIVDFWKRNIK